MDIETQVVARERDRESTTSFEGREERRQVVC